MGLVERLRKQASLFEAAIWSDGLYQIEQEDMRALLTEAADHIEFEDYFYLKSAMTEMEQKSK